MRKILLFFIIFFVTNLYGYYSPWTPLLQHLNTYYSLNNLEAFKITKVSGNTLNFLPLQNSSLFPGSELIIKRKGNNPLNTETLGFAKFIGYFNQTGTANIVYQLKDVTPGDFLLKPYSRKVIVFTNVKNKYAFKPYNDLVQALTFNNFSVFEIDKPQDISILNMSEYNLLIRLEYSPGIITAKIQSLYDRSILFSQSFQFPYMVETKFPPNVNICFKEFKARSRSFFSKSQEEEVYVKKSGKEYSFTHGNIEEGKVYHGEYEIVRYKLTRPAVRMVVADVDGDGKKEFVTINNYSVDVYKIIGPEHLKLYKVFSYRKSDIIAIHLHKGDFNKNGRDELFITLTQKTTYMEQIDNKLCSMIVELGKNGKFKIINKNLPYYLRVIESRDGRPHLLCQKEGEYEPYDGKIYEMRWDGKKFVKGSEFPPAKNVYSIYGFIPHPDKRDYTLIIDRFGNIAGYYAPSEKKVELFDEGLGIYNVIKYPIKLRDIEFRGGFEKVTYREVRAYRRLVYKRNYNKQIFTIKTPSSKDITRKILKKLIRNEEEPDRIIGIKWTSHGIVKSWESKPVYETIIDFSFIHEPNSDKLVILTIDKEGNYWIKTLQ